MAKTAGIAWTTCSVDDSGGVVRAIVNDITNLTMSTPRAEQDVTGLDKSAHERLQLLADMSVQLTGVFNPASNQSHDVFKTVPSTSVARTVTNTVGGKTLAGELYFSDYNLTRGADGAFTFQAPGVLADGTTPTWA